MESEADLLWYVAYGSNLAIDRLRFYLAGGQPLGGLRTYAGARDPGEPRQTRPVELPGVLVFAGRSRAWSGGIAFYHPGVVGRVVAQAYLLTREQVSDLVAQETRRPSGTELDLLAARPHASRPLGGGAYDTVLRLEDAEGYPSVTITSSRALEPRAPSSSYLRWICCGLHEAFDWSPGEIAEYLGRFEGVRGTWTAAELTGLAGDAAQAAQAAATHTE